MPLQSDTVSEGNMFSGCLSAAFVHSFVTTTSQERLAQSWWNLQGVFISPYWWPH